LALAPEGNVMALSTLAGDIALYDGTSLRVQGTRSAAEGESLYAFDLNHESLVAAVSHEAPSRSSTQGQDRGTRIVVADLGSGRGGDVLKLPERVRRMRVARRGKYLLLSTDSRTVSVVDLGAATVVASWGEVDVLDLAISGHGDQIAWATASGVVVGAPDSPQLRTLECKQPPSLLQFAERGRVLYAVAGEELIRFELPSSTSQVFPLPGSATAFGAASNGAVLVANEKGLSLLEGEGRRDTSDGSVPGDAPRFVVVDAALRRAFVASRASIAVYDLQTLARVGVVRDTLSDIPKAFG